MTGIEVAILNRSTVVRDHDVEKAVASLQTQVSRDFNAAWGIDARLSFVPQGKKPPDTWQVVILDNSDQAGALGYHDLTKSGQPLGKVFAATDLQYHLKWSVTASHELLEMLADPNINLVAFAPDGTLYAYEVCDACEADSFSYKIDGVDVSDFVFPGWFEPLHIAKGEAFDQQGKIKKPLSLLPGGYIGVYRIEKGSGWTQLTSKGKLDYAFRPPVGSRRERRRTPMDQWLRSKV